MTDEEILLIKKILKENPEITVSLIEDKMKVNFKEANYIISLLEKANIINNQGSLIIHPNSIDTITLNDDRIIKDLDLMDDIMAIIKRDNKFDSKAIETELNIRCNLMFDLIQELLSRNVIERYESSYILKK